jgi:hypothetical protein
MKSLCFRLFLSLKKSCEIFLNLRSLTKSREVFLNLWSLTKLWKSQKVWWNCMESLGMFGSPLNSHGVLKSLMKFYQVFQEFEVSESLLKSWSSLFPSSECLRVNVSSLNRYHCFFVFPFEYKESNKKRIKHIAIFNIWINRNGSSMKSYWLIFSR